MNYLDFETYSEAGFIFDKVLRKWVKPHKRVNKSGLALVGAYNYASHPSTEILIAAYSLGGDTVKYWTPGMPPPSDLLEAVRRRESLLAHNCLFEYYVWNQVGVRCFGWPELHLDQLRDTKPRAYAFSLPGSLGSLSKVWSEIFGMMPVSEQKDSEGTRLIKMFSCPRNPTKKDPSLRKYMLNDIPNARKFIEYCVQDVKATIALDRTLPQLSKSEFEAWQYDISMNAKGVKLDIENVERQIKHFEKAESILSKELLELVNYEINSHTQNAKLANWLTNNGMPTKLMTKDRINEMIEEAKNPVVKRVLQLKRNLSGSSVNKLYTMKYTADKDGRVHDILEFHGTTTGRGAGRGIQVQNIKRSGPATFKCVNCGKLDMQGVKCKHCGGEVKYKDWDIECIKEAIRDPFQWSDTIGAITGSMRGLLVAEEGKKFISSDYSAIEAAVLAVVAQEQWRIDVFKGDRKIYEKSASNLTGTPLSEFDEHKKKHGTHHFLRKLGKIMELASGYAGGETAILSMCKTLGMDPWSIFKDSEDIKKTVYKWRDASPNIKILWDTVQEIAIQAILNPGRIFEFKNIKFKRATTKVGELRCQLPSGRVIVYHKPLIKHEGGRPSIYFYKWLGNGKSLSSWVQTYTYGGKLVENIIQAVSRDILIYAIMQLVKRGYPVRFHVHDEIICEVDKNFGSVEGLEGIMSIMPNWAKGWPIAAFGGWEGREFRKE